MPALGAGFYECQQFLATPIECPSHARQNVRTADRLRHEAIWNCFEYGERKLATHDKATCTLCSFSSRRDRNRNCSYLIAFPCRFLYCPTGSFALSDVDTIHYIKINKNNNKENCTYNSRLIRTMYTHMCIYIYVF